MSHISVFPGRPSRSGVPSDAIRDVKAENACNPIAKPVGAAGAVTAPTLVLLLLVVLLVAAAGAGESGGRCCPDPVPVPGP